MLNTTGNLYGNPNSVLGGADALMANINNVGASTINGNGSGFINFNGTNGCYPLAGNYTPVPGYGSISGFGGSNSVFGYGNSSPFYDTNISYNRTNNPDGSFSTSYHNGTEMNTLGYMNAIGSGIVGGIGYYFQSKAAQAAQETQQQGQALAYMAQKEQYTQNMEMYKQQSQFNMDMQKAQFGVSMSLIKAMMGNMDTGNA